MADQWRAPAQVQVGGAVVLGALLVLLPFIVSGPRMPTYTDALVKVILFLSLGLLVRLSGQISLCHATFAAIGAAAMAHLTTDLGLPWLVALVLAALIVVPVGAFIAIPAIRLSGVFLALATFGFGIAVEQMGYPLKILFGSSSSGVTIPRPGWEIFNGDRGYYYLVLLFVALTAAAVVLIHRGRLGRLLRGLGDSPTALATHGTNVNTTRVLVFCISAFIAGLYGGLYGGAVGTLTGASFTSFSSLVLVAVVVISIGGTPWFAFVAAAGLTLPGAYITSEEATHWLNVVFGLLAVMVSLTGGPLPMHGARRLVDRMFRQASAPTPVPAEATASPAGDALRPAAAGGPAAEAASTHRSRPVPGDGEGVRPRTRPGAAGADDGIQIDRLTVRFGGNVAVREFSLSAPPGRITGLIGPNGAGKTTTFNACSGLLRPTTGTVRLHGRDVSRLGPAARARRGLGRTFQRMELFDSMTVRENIMIGREASMAGAQPWRHLAGSPREHRVVTETVETAARTCGLVDLLERPVGALSTGERRLVELARCLAGPFDVLLLDEPSSGLNRVETARFADVLTSAVAERNLAVLLVEHDMELVMDICDYLYVVDFGVPIFEGPPAEVAASEVVRAAYLGSEITPADTDVSADLASAPATANGVLQKATSAKEMRS